MFRKASIWIIIFIIFTVSIVCGYFIAKNIRLKNEISYKKEKLEQELMEEEIKKLEKAKIVNSKEDKVGANTQVILKTNYSMCGHKEEYIEEQANVVNLNKNELEELYTGWHITNFSDKEVDLEKNIQGICGEHYIVKEENGLIVVYRKKINEETGKLDKEKCTTTDISSTYLTEKDLETLKVGVEIYGRESLNKFLEDYE